MGPVLFVAALSASAQIVAPVESVRFQTAPVVASGSLGDQARAARKAIRGRIFRLRAFVTADEDIATLGLSAPAMAVIRVTELPVPGAKLVLEAVTDGGKNPHGLVYVSGQGSSKEQSSPEVKPLVEATYRNLDLALTAAKVTPRDVLTVTCYLSSLADVKEVQGLTASRYPNSVRSYLRTPVAPGRGFVECEAVARASGRTGFVNPEGLTKSPNFTHVAGIHTRNVFFSGLIAAASCDANGVRGMFQDLASKLASHGGDIKNVAFSFLYPNSSEATNLTRNIRFDFYARSQPPASTLIGFSGVGDKKACTAVEVAAESR